MTAFKQERKTITPRNYTFRKNHLIDWSGK